MNHQPFEEWLFAEDPLESDQNRQLQEHLEGCTHCSQLDDTLKLVEHRLSAAPMVGPAPGFAQRWQAQLAERQQRAILARQRKITWIVLGIFAGSALALLGYLGAQQIATYTSINQMFFELGRNFSLVIRSINDFREVLSNIIRYLPFTIPVTIWILIGSNLAVLSLGWVYSLWRIALPKGIKSK